MPTKKIKAKPKTKSKSKAHARKTSGHVSSKSVKKSLGKSIHAKARKTLKKKKTHSAKKKTLTKISAPHKKAKAKNKVFTKSKFISHLDDAEKEQLLFLVKEIINLHKEDEGGLKSLASVEKIIDRYNQQYTHVSDKFDAIVKLSIRKNPENMDKHFYVAVKGREKSVDDLYTLLALIGKGKMDFESAKEKMLYIYEEMPAAKYGKGLNIALAGDGSK